MTPFNSTTFIKSIKDGYDRIPYIQGDRAARILVADAIKSNGFNPEDVLSFISKEMKLSNTLGSKEWKEIVDNSIKAGDPVGKTLKVYKAALKGKLSYEEMFNLAATCCGKNPVYLVTELRLNQFGWKKAVEALVNTTVEEKPAEKKTSSKAVKKGEGKAPIKTAHKDPRRKSVTLVKNGVEKTWNSYRECEIELGAGHGTVSQAISGKVKSVKGWTLKKESTKVRNPLAHPKHKAVIQCGKDKNGRKVNKVWPSLTEAAKATGVPYSSISKALSGTYQSAGGYTWKEAETAA